MEDECMVGDRNTRKNTYPSKTNIGAALAVDRARLEERLAPMSSITSITTLWTNTY